MADERATDRLQAIVHNLGEFAIGLRDPNLSMLVDQLDAAVRAASSVPHWQPVNTAPKNVWILGWDEGGFGCYRLHGDFDGGDYIPTHWQPLPDPPVVSPTPQGAPK